MFGSMFLMTQYWQFVHGYTPLEAGVRLIPFAVAMMVTGPAVGAGSSSGSAPSASSPSGWLIVAIGLLCSPFIEPTPSYAACSSSSCADGASAWA